MWKNSRHREITYSPFEVKCKDWLDKYDLRGMRAFRETYMLDDMTWVVPWDCV